MSPRTKPTLLERGALLKERVYITFTALAVVLTLGTHPEDYSSRQAAVTLFVTVIGALLAMFLADLISHLVVHSALPTRAELRHMLTVVLGSLVAVVPPLALVGLSALQIMTLETALNLSVAALLGALLVISFIAVHRVAMATWKRLIVLLAEVILGAIVLALQLLAHS